MICRPQLCNGECEFSYDDVDEFGHPVGAAFNRKCPRHAGLTDGVAISRINDESERHNDIIALVLAGTRRFDVGTVSGSCSISDDVLECGLVLTAAERTAFNATIGLKHGNRARFK